MIPREERVDVVALALLGGGATAIERRADRPRAAQRAEHGLATVSAIAGQDPDARERDAELAGSFYAPVAPRLALGVAVRGRRALGTPGPGEPRADALAAPFAALAFGRTTLIATAGLDAIDRGAAGRAAGALGQLGLTVDW